MKGDEYLPIIRNELVIRQNYNLTTMYSCYISKIHIDIHPKWSHRPTKEIIFGSVYLIPTQTVLNDVNDYSVPMVRNMIHIKNTILQ